MSWLARSLVNSLRGEEELDHDQQQQQDEHDHENNQHHNQDRDDDDDGDPSRGVKEDLTELTKTLTRQFWGVASFLAPPPTDPGQRPDPTPSDEVETSVTTNSPRFAGIRGNLSEIGGRFRGDLSDIGGRFKSGISILSNTKAASEISKIATTLKLFGDEEDEEGESEEVEEKSEGGVVGVTDEVVAFARNVSMHPETWLDFPLVADEDDYGGLVLLANSPSILLFILCFLSILNCCIT